MPCAQKGQQFSPVGLLRLSMMPPEKTTAYMASTPTVDETIGLRPTAAQPLNKALDAKLVRKSTKKYVKNLQMHSSTSDMGSSSSHSVALLMM